jgi:uncharacterized protein YbaR (Trm112 family)
LKTLPPAGSSPTPELLAILCCPETRQPLHLASAEVLARVTREGLCDQSGAVVTPPLEAGLLCADGTLLYPIRGGIAILLSEARIPL